MLPTITSFIFYFFPYSINHDNILYFFSFRYLPVDVDTKVQTTSQQRKNKKYEKL
jgi:hypothetical protein